MKLQGLLARHPSPICKLLPLYVTLVVYTKFNGHSYFPNFFLSLLQKEKHPSCHPSDIIYTKSNHKLTTVPLVPSTKDWLGSCKQVAVYVSSTLDKRQYQSRDETTNELHKDQVS